MDTQQPPITTDMETLQVQQEAIRIVTATHRPPIPIDTVETLAPRILIRIVMATQVPPIEIVQVSPSALQIVIPTRMVILLRNREAITPIQAFGLIDKNLSKI
jgi:hypothetical protein